ncbi:hypothetical protein C8J57DRAFT_1623933 [Mycena rebaudengoi]|nr:hypothetical protein C8J57DRAFT_1623933 [Mycena rebaudengoi]
MSGSDCETCASHGSWCASEYLRESSAAAEDPYYEYQPTQQDAQQQTYRRRKRRKHDDKHDDKRQAGSRPQTPSPTSSPPARDAALMSSMINQDLYAPGGMLDSQMESYAWVLALEQDGALEEKETDSNGESSPEIQVRPRTNCRTEDVVPPAPVSSLQEVKREDTPPPDVDELTVLRERCAQQSDKIAELFGVLDAAQEKVRYYRERAAKWEQIAGECARLVGQSKGLLETASDQLEFGP